jgi:hypothetical protein
MHVLEIIYKSKYFVFLKLIFIYVKQKKIIFIDESK